MLSYPRTLPLPRMGAALRPHSHTNIWLAVVGDFGAYERSPGIPGLVDETYTFGPRFSYRRRNRLTPFAQAVGGRGHANVANGGFFGAKNAFAFGGGAGGHLGLDRGGRFALRGQLEFLNFRTNHNLPPHSDTGAFRLSVGVVFRMGEKLGEQFFRGLMKEET